MLIIADIVYYCIVHVRERSLIIGFSAYGGGGRLAPIGHMDSLLGQVSDEGVRVSCVCGWEGSYGGVVGVGGGDGGWVSV